MDIHKGKFVIISKILEYILLVPSQAAQLLQWFQTFLLLSVVLLALVFVTSSGM